MIQKNTSPVIAPGGVAVERGPSETNSWFRYGDCYAEISDSPQWGASIIVRATLWPQLLAAVWEPIETEVTARRLVAASTLYCNPSMADGQNYDHVSLW